MYLNTNVTYESFLSSVSFRPVLIHITRIDVLTIGIQGLSHRETLMAIQIHYYTFFCQFHTPSPFFTILHLFVEGLTHAFSHLPTPQDVIIYLNDPLPKN